MDTLKIITNNKPRPLIGWHDLTPAEQAEFDYLQDPEEGTFFRYKFYTFDLGEATRVDLEDWHGSYADSAFSGVLIRLTDDCESVVVGRWLG